MAYPAQVINVMIASPSDVAEVRQKAIEIIHEWNSLNAQRQSTVLLPMVWESHAAPSMGDRPQSIINKQVLHDADLLVAIFWTRLGTPTGKHPSGTVEEIREHIDADKPAMLYFSNAPVEPLSIDETQYRALRAFIDECKQDGLIWEFGSTEEFTELFRRQLSITVNENFLGENAEVVPFVLAEEEQGSLPVISEPALELLSAATKDDLGLILIARSTSGDTLIAGKRSFGGPAREAAKWRSALQDLLRLHLVEEREYDQVYVVTDAGYRLIESSG